MTIRRIPARRRLSVRAGLLAGGLRDRGRRRRRGSLFRFPHRRRERADAVPPSAQPMAGPPSFADIVERV